MDEILISGYYGFKNSGDDALLLSIINDLKKLRNDIKIVVLSSNPKETKHVYGVRSVNRLNIFSIIPAMLRAKMLISGGGTLIQDGTSTKSLIYYLMIIAAAKFFGLKVMLYSNGIGPLIHDKNIARTRKILNRVDLITLRDEASARELERIGVDKPKICVTADPVFTLETPGAERGREILKSVGADTDKRLLCVSVRDWKGARADFEECVAEAADYAAERYGFYPVFLPMQLKTDCDISYSVAAKMRGGASVVDRDLSTEDMLSVMGSMDLCIGMRLHTLIYSAASAVPLIGIVYDPKVSGFMEYMRQTRYADIGDMDCGTLKGLIDSAMADYDAIKSEVAERMELLKTRAAENAKLAAELLEK